MYYRAEPTKFFVGVGMNPEFGSVVEYEFEVDSDGLLLLQGGFAGVEDEAEATDTATLSGTFLDNGAFSGSFTTTPTDTATGSFTGQCMYFRHYGDNRGGMWRITLDNGMTRDYSTYRTSAGDVGYVPIFENLPQGTYQYSMAVSYTHLTLPTTPYV